MKYVLNGLKNVIPDLKTIVACLLLVGVSSCAFIEQVIDDIEIPDTTSTTTTTTTSTTTTQPDASGVDLTKIKWLGKNYSGAKETTKLNSATISGDRISISYEPYSWPLNDDGGCDAIACFFYRKGEGITGGKFDWIRKGGQKVKGLENVKGGYGGHEMPARGTDAWLMWVSVDGKQRSNFLPVAWK